MSTAHGPAAKPPRLPWMAALDHKLARLDGGGGGTQALGVLHWLGQLNEEDAAAAQAVVDRLDQLTAHLDAAGLGRWILTGVRLYPQDVQRQRAYFRLDDPQAVRALHGESSAPALHRALPWLALLLEGLVGRRLVLQPRAQSQLHGPALRPAVTGSHLLLPDSYTALDGDRHRLYRATVAHAAAHLLHSTPQRPVASLKPLGVAVVSAIEDARVERLLWRELPGVRGWFLEFLQQAPDPSDLSFAALLARMSRALADDEHLDGNFWVDKARRLFHEEIDRSGLEDYDAFRRVASILSNDLGQMRVRFNPQQYAVPTAYRDDNSFLWDFGDAPVQPEHDEELHVRSAALERTPCDVATSENPHRDEPQAGAAVETGRFSYAEWDHRIGRVRADWCTVVERQPAWRMAGPAPGMAADALPRMALTRSRRLSRTRRLRRQWEGDDLDLNAAIEVLVDRRLGLAPEARLFMRPGSEALSSSVLVLLDLSESTNDPLPGSNRTLLDIEKQAALMLAQALSRATDRLAIHGFASDTRSAVYYDRMLDFGHVFDPRVASMIGSVQAGMSTRVGAALRHATACLADEPSDRRAILLVTDGAPSDVDVFEPRYLIEDAAESVAEAVRRGIRCACVAVDRQADAYVRRIFGWNNYRIVDAPDSLPRHLSELFARVTAS